MQLKGTLDDKGTFENKRTLEIKSTIEAQPPGAGADVRRGCHNLILHVFLVHDWTITCKSAASAVTAGPFRHNICA